tara:strand:- start:11 stop:1438 length:1428 start_codon:yes stop_codon:yes gene_type:complete
MKFTKLEEIMNSYGAITLAEIARYLDTSPQAVSNWKARDRVPHHIVSKINNFSNSNIDYDKSQVKVAQNILDNESVSLSDFLLILSEQLKIIFIVSFIFVFFSFTYVKFIKEPLYVSWATIIVPEKTSSTMGSLAGLASQFGVNVPTASQTDLSSPSLFPELIRSRAFAEKILEKSFYTHKFQKSLSLLAILTVGDNPVSTGKDTLVTNALSALSQLIKYKKEPGDRFSIIEVKAAEAVFARDLATVVIEELEKLNRYYKSKRTSDKIVFINNRINSVKNDLLMSEKNLKSFNEQNRQISSPALELEQERLARDVEVQKNIYMTLKQQLELAKIEEVQEASILQVLDEPQTPLNPVNINVFSTVVLGAFAGLGLGVLLGFGRSYFNNSNIDERKKLRRVRNFIKKKIKDIFIDYRILGMVILVLAICFPFYLGHESKNPVYFGKYSFKLAALLFTYFFVLLTMVGRFIFVILKKR